MLTLYIFYYVGETQQILSRARILTRIKESILAKIIHDVVFAFTTHKLNECTGNQFDMIWSLVREKKQQKHVEPK